MAKKRGLTKDQHGELGEKLRGAEAILRTAWSQITEAYPVNNKEQGAAERAYRAVEALLVRMDDAEYRDNSEQYDGSYIRVSTRVMS